MHWKIDASTFCDFDPFVKNEYFMDFDKMWMRLYIVLQPQLAIWARVTVAYHTSIENVDVLVHRDASTL